MHYTVGFIFNLNLKKVLLIHKLNPSWQKNKLNGIGGKFEKGEKSLDCIVREVYEETGVKIQKRKWLYVGEIKEGDSMVDFYTTVFKGKGNEFKSAVKEKVGWYNVIRLPKTIMPNLAWLIPFTIEKISDRNLQSFKVSYIQVPTGTKI